MKATVWTFLKGGGCMYVHFSFNFKEFLKQIVNLIITGIILYFASRLFPERIQIDSFRTLAIAAGLLFVAEFVVAIVILLLMFFSALSQNWAGVIAGFIGVFFGEILALSLLSAWLPGLSINGFWTKVCLALVLSIFRIPSNNNQQ